MAGKGGFIPGAGRKKGTPNKRTLEAIELSERLDCNPLEILLLFAKGDWKALGYSEKTVTKFYGETMVIEDVIQPELRQKSAKDACEYIYAKRKAIDVVSNGETLSAPILNIVPPTDH